MALLVKEGPRCFTEEHCNVMRTCTGNISSSLLRAARVVGVIVSLVAIVAKCQAVSARWLSWTFVAT